MEVLLYILYVLGILYLFIWAIKAIIRSATNLPTWSGIIISAILGMLPFYLILCYFGIMGEKRNEYLNDSQSPTGTYAENMSRQYDYDTSSKNTGWLKFAVLVFVIMFSFHLFSNDSKEQEDINLTETMATENVISEEQIEETPVVVKKKAPVREDNTDFETTENLKSTLKLLEEENHADVVKQAKEAGVSTEGSTLDILKRIQHANVVEQAKEAGVSTEGSTLDILKRIQQKMLEDYHN